HARRAGHRRSLVALHLRARGAPAFAGGLAVVTLASWSAAHWLTSREWSGGAIERWPVVAVAPAVTAALASTGLAGSDEELERTTAVPLRRIRVLHVIIVAAVAGAALGLIGLWEPRTYGAFELARNTVACVGAAALTAVVFGARLAWGPVCAYVGVVTLVAPVPLVPGSSWWAWPVHPWSAELAAWTAGALFAAGLLLYGRLGPRPSRDEDDV
ncbi:MAG: hypothetical protein ACOCUN_01440, partial [Jiangellaceae bacterium]